MLFGFGGKFCLATVQNKYPARGSELLGQSDIGALIPESLMRSNAVKSVSGGAILEIASV